MGRITIGTLVLFVGVIYSIQGLPQSVVPESVRISALKREVVKDRLQAVTSFWKDMAANGSPLIESAAEYPNYLLATFVWRGSEARFVNIVGQLTDLPAPSFAMTRMPDTDLWYQSILIPKKARVQYQIETQGEKSGDRLVQADPLNPKRLESGRDEFDTPDVFSIVEMPDAARMPDWLERKTNVANGKIERYEWKSKVLNNERSYWVYTPAEYRPKGAPYGVLVVLDGFESRDQIATTLDNLIAQKRIPALVALFIGNAKGARPREFVDRPPDGGSLREEFPKFLDVEMVPWLRSNFNVSTDPSKIVIAGKSAGGWAAAFASLRHPELFGNVLSQSGSFQWGAPPVPEWLTQEFIKSSKLPLKFYLDVGIYEGSGMLLPTRHFLDVLTGKGNSVHYVERNGGHGVLSYWETFGDGLIWLIGRS